MNQSAVQECSGRGEREEILRSIIRIYLVRHLFHTV